MRLLLCFCLLFSAVIAAQVSDPLPHSVANKATAMWRLDFMHSGGKGVAETFQIKRLVLEPQPWTAPLHDPLQRGDYKIELFAAGATTPWFSHSYSSVFSDWRRGSDAATTKQSFQESVRFPAPRSKSTLVISSRDLRVSGQPFREVWQTDIEVDSLMASPTPEPELQVRQLHHSHHSHQSGSPAASLDLLFVAEGFTRAEQDKFFQAAEAATSALLSVEPYRSLQQQLNVRAMFLPSATSGLGGDTAFKVNPNALGMARYALTMETWRLNQVAMHAPYDNIVILTNSNQYSASGIYRAYTVVPAFEPRLKFLLVHELGHHLAGLADEYFHDTPGYAQHTAVVEPHEPNVTALLPGTKPKWGHLIKTSTPVPTPWPQARYLSSMNKDQSWLKQLPWMNEVGVFQGANYSATDYYRPALNCLMFRDGGDNQFCPVCSHAIVETIRKSGNAIAVDDNAIAVDE